MPKRKVKINNEQTAAELKVRQSIGKKIKEMRNKLGFSALKVSKHLGISREAVTHIETGRNNISAVGLWKLATLFNCQVSDFFPDIPNGFALTSVDLHKLAQEDQSAADWAEKIFNKQK
ncbi:MAG: hypothetical protein COY01_02930 [Candidatus Pacebacteria bacterium CG_4_10_14_0_2_um_filter_40_20]|nr:MAG: hypothetical protein COY01_02930 [Candidatus Pacebacteria bacterium CG_4_10_14_0_2_um_filter_40_20]